MAERTNDADVAEEFRHDGTNLAAECARLHGLAADYQHRAEVAERTLRRVAKARGCDAGQVVERAKAAAAVCEEAAYLAGLRAGPSDCIEDVCAAVRAYEGAEVPR